MIELPKRLCIAELSILPFMDYDVVNVDFPLEIIESRTTPSFFVTGEIWAQFGKQFWSVSGYDDDPREIYQIDEVRSYFKALHKHYPGWMALLNFEGPMNLAVLFCLLPKAPIWKSEGQLSFDLRALKEVLKSDMDACLRMVAAGQISEELLNKQFGELRKLLP